LDTDRNPTRLAPSEIPKEQQFIRFACEQRALQFGHFVTKAGRSSPYFFNTGSFSSGMAFAQLCEFYADRLLATGMVFDVLYGPAYKGIPLAVGISIELAKRGLDIPYSFNRKENKNHGEGGNLVGAAPIGKVLIVDDVITAGTSIGESVDVILAQGGQPAAVLVAFDRQEKGSSERSAVQDIMRKHRIPVFSVARLCDLLEYLREENRWADTLLKMKEYMEKYSE